VLALAIGGGGIKGLQEGIEAMGRGVCTELPLRMGNCPKALVGDGPGVMAP
jgi:hypothetical protein